MYIYSYSESKDDYTNEMNVETRGYFGGYVFNPRGIVSLFAIWLFLVAPSSVLLFL